MSLQIQIDRAQVAEFCRRHRIKRLALFGSVLREDFRPDSDVDVLVGFEEGHVPGFFRLMDMQAELSGLLGWQADLRTAEDLSRYSRDDEVVAQAEVQYAA